MSRQNSRLQFLGKVVFLLFLCFWMNGCAASSGRIDRKSGFVKIDRVKYSSLEEICKQYKLICEWDEFSQIIKLKSREQRVSLFPGSALILRDDQVVDLRAPVRFYQGKVLVPVSIFGIFTPFAEKPGVPADARSRVFAIKRIVIDAGHGGRDPGAVGSRGIKEKDIVLDVARRLGAELKKQQIEVFLTRDDDTFYPLEERADFANARKADLFISVHANAAEAASAFGFEAYYLSVDYDDFSKAVQLRENAAALFEESGKGEYADDFNATLWDMILTENRIESMSLSDCVAEELKKDLKLNTRYVRGAMFAVLKGARMPAVLLEIGYLTNPRECEQLNNPYYRQMLAESICLGIMRYKKEFESNNGFSR